MVPKGQGPYQLFLGHAGVSEPALAVVPRICHMCDRLGRESWF